MRNIITLLFLLFLFAVTLPSQPTASAQDKRYVASLAYWNIEGLYDTLPSIFYNDTKFTPTGAYNWNTEHYMDAVGNIAAALDSMSIPIVMLYGVENESVVLDIVEQSNSYYNFVHATCNSLRGLDFALLYYGDLFQVERIFSERDMLIVEGVLRGENVTLVGTQSGRYLSSYKFSKEGHTIVMGAFSPSDINHLPLRDVLQKQTSRGYGNTRKGSRWSMHSRIAVGEAIKPIRSGVYIKEWLLTPDKTAPNPRFKGGVYNGGYSSYLPVFVYIE